MDAFRREFLKRAGIGIAAAAAGGPSVAAHPAGTHTTRKGRSQNTLTKAKVHIVK